jgi:outer membrane protein insertion porin family
MRTLIFFLLLTGSLLAQDDSPPEYESPADPDLLPPLDAPLPDLKGKLAVSFVGATAFAKNQLRTGIIRQIQTIEQFGLDAPNAYDARYYLEAFYHNHGYAHAEVADTIEGPWSLRLTIKEGPRALIGDIHITGNHTFTTEALMKYLLGPLREANPRIRKITDLPVDDEALYGGTDLIRRFYASSGYLNANVEAPVITYNAEQTSATIELTLTEGIAFRFGAIHFTGSPALPRQEMLAVMAKQTKSIYTNGRLDAATRALEDLYQKRGYFTSTVLPSADPETARDGMVPVTFEIEAGPIYHFSGVTVTGNERVKPSFIQRRLRNLQGKPYNPAAIEKSFRELNQTGLFQNLRMVTEAEPGDAVRLDVTVEEAKTKEFSFGLGYASYYGGLLSASYRDLNFLGNSRPFSVNLEASQKSLNGDILYTDPWWFDSDYKLQARLFANNEDLKGYSTIAFGVQPTISRDLTEHWNVSTFVIAKYVTTYDIEIKPASLVGREDYSVVSIGFTQTLDYRNSPTLPTRGYIFSTTVEVAPQGLGDVSFVRGLGRFSYYLPVTTKSTFALGARAGVIAPLGGQGLPIDERFFSGGATTVRSFSEFSLGPRDRSGYPLGGQAFTVFNAEYIFPIIGDLHGAVFVDAGNVISKAEDFGLENMRYAVGAGLRYNLPIGSLRLDYGLNPDPKNGEAQGAFHFAVGVAF